MSRRASTLDAPPAPPASRVAEWLTILVLLAMAVALLWINRSLLRRDTTDRLPPFDLKNPMLDVRDHECVEVYAPATPHDAPCLSALENGLVLRPASGPKRIGDQDDLRHAAPYLAARSRRSTPGSGGCAAGKTVEGEEIVLYGLNGFGLPRERVARADSIEPVLTESGGRERVVYLVVLEDATGTTWKCYVTPEALLTGLVKVELLSQTQGARPQHVFYRDVGTCP